jgi:N-acetylglucosaminyl-diphospho-decaprenol L-rhamnosyltransferase
VTRDRRDRLLATLGHLAALPERPSVLVVDNGSRDSTPAAVRDRFPDVGVLELGRNRGTAARNVGLRALDVPYVALCDDDSWWAPGALSRAVAVLQSVPRLAVAAARVLVGVREALDPVCALMARSPLPVEDGLPGARVLGFVACGAVVRRDAVLGVGGFDERYGIGGEESRLALDLARAGWWLAYAPDVVAYHHPERRAGASARTRRARAARNDLWTAWLRRPLCVALRQSAAILAAAGPLAPQAALAATRGAWWVARERGTLPDAAEDDARLLDRFG